MEGSYFWEKVNSRFYVVNLVENMRASMGFTMPTSQNGEKGGYQFSIYFRGDEITILGDVGREERDVFISPERKVLDSKIFLRGLNRLRSAEGLEGIGAERMLEFYNSLDALEQGLMEGWRNKVKKGVLRGLRRIVA